MSKENDERIERNKIDKERCKKNDQRIYELKKKSPGVAVFLSLLFTGAGHFYLGKIGKGFGMLFLQIGLWIILMGWVMWIVTPILAYHDAKKHNELLRIRLGLNEDLK